MAGLNSKSIGEISYFEFLVAIIIGYILVSLWQTFLDNFLYNALKLKKDSVLESLIVAMFATTIFILYIFSFSSTDLDLVASDTPITSSLSSQTQKMKLKRKKINEKTNYLESIAIGINDNLSYV